MISFWIISVRFRLTSRRNDWVLKTGTKTVFTLLSKGARIEYPHPPTADAARTAPSRPISQPDRQDRETIGCSWFETRWRAWSAPPLARDTSAS